MNDREPTSATLLAAYRDWLRGSATGTTALQAVQEFLDQHWHAARAAGWSDLDLFGCHPDPEFARVC